MDFTELRAARQERVYAAMAEAELDVLVLGRPSSIAYVTGARALWTAGSRPFSPSCIVMREDRRIHLLATWDEGVPDEIPHEQLFGLSWNPSIAAGNVKAIRGLDRAGRIGADGTSVGFNRLLADAAPDAELVDARDLLHRARSAVLGDELLAIETACALAEAGLEDMCSALGQGRTTRQLLGVLAERLGQMGEPVVPDEAIGFATARGHRSVVDDHPFDAGELVALRPSARYAGYVGAIARTVAVGGELTDAQRSLGRRCREALDAVIGACVPGVSGDHLRSVWRDAGGGPLPAPLVTGLGLGVQRPIIDDAVGGAEALGDGMVVAVHAWLPDDQLGGWLEGDVVAVTADGPLTLTRWSDPA